MVGYPCAFIHYHWVSLWISHRNLITKEVTHAYLRTILETVHTSLHAISALFVLQKGTISQSCYSSTTWYNIFTFWSSGLLQVPILWIKTTIKCRNYPYESIERTKHSNYSGTLYVALHVSIMNSWWIKYWRNNGKRRRNERCHL